jgi:2-C-methyl-D-erythritol 2,4-cyclodiphosphate synthase
MYRIGEGFDLHTLAPDRPLIIGGVTIPHEKGLDGHSDADVLIHALIDALLGACGMGDIGQQFPDTDPQWKGASSRILLGKVSALVVEAGYSVVNMDSTVIAQRPRLSGHIQDMRVILSRDLGIPIDAVNVKAKTSEHVGSVGREECIVATVSVLLKKT